MYNDQADYQLQSAKCAGTLGAAQFIPPTSRQRLEAQKSLIEGQLFKVNSAIAALDENPSLEAFMEVMRAAGV